MFNKKDLKHKILSTVIFLKHYNKKIYINCIIFCDECQYYLLKKVGLFTNKSKTDAAQTHRELFACLRSIYYFTPLVAFLTSCDLSDFFIQEKGIHMLLLHVIAFDLLFQKLRQPPCIRDVVGSATAS